MAFLFIPQPNAQMSALKFLQHHFNDHQWTEFRAAVAFVKRSGIRHIGNFLRDFSKRGEVDLTVGISLEGSSRQGLQGLLNSLEGRGKLWVFYNEVEATFHPKIYLFKNDTKADVVIGSANLTEGGLFSNYEASCAISLDLNHKEDQETLYQIEVSLDYWSGGDPRISKPLNQEFLDALVDNYYVPDESEVREYGQPSGRSRRKTSNKRALFERVPVLKAPPPPVDETILDDDDLLINDEELEGIYDEDDELRDDLAEEDFIVITPKPAPPQPGNHRVFLMTLKRTDVGIGQTTSGKSRRSPEIFIPLSARDYDGDFWGWETEFVEDPQRPGKWDRRGVRMRIGTITTEVTMMTWPVKHDFRLRSEILRSAGNVDDILRIERTDGEGGFSYYVEIIPFGTVEYEEYLVRCTCETRNSQKKWGYY
ncbi:phospholipase D family protein [Candidatus Chloroploca asiatica]|uniref:PLD phosphodiesterase domain-containing protein n=1 Tax=Candidatus Chloroploca asiatica TaxID=1506545 RepID=A0A2H3L2J4_9CHLR|nr:phospholipase D family protein [Candidatus Chloroploca asiatica]PDV97367.1 hypothetical protein A9Q02_22520 [Candidatus Chloroploca asiatica]